MEAKRKRSQNFTAEEKLVFVRTLQEIGQVLISKVTAHDARTNKEKEAVWEKITNHLNASSYTIRNVDSYKKLWAKLKSDAKTYKSKAQNQSKGTGGGPHEVRPDPVLDAVIEITGRGSTGVQGVIDADNAVNVNQLIENAVVQIQGMHTIQRDDGQAHIPTDDHMIQRDDGQAHIPTEFIIESNVLDECEVVIEETEREAKEEIMNKENKNTPINHYKRRRPILSQVNERTPSLSTKLVQTKLKVEAQKLELLKNQELYMKEQHEIKMKNDQKLQILKEGILEDIRKKIRDGEKVDAEILKTMF